MTQIVGCNLEELRWYTMGGKKEEGAGVGGRGLRQKEGESERGRGGKKE